MLKRSPQAYIHRINPWRVHRPRQSNQKHSFPEHTAVLVFPASYVASPQPFDSGAYPSAQGAPRIEDCSHGSQLILPPRQWKIVQNKPRQKTLSLEGGGGLKILRREKELYSTKIAGRYGSAKRARPFGSKTPTSSSAQTRTSALNSPPTYPSRA